LTNVQQATVAANNFVKTLSVRSRVHVREVMFFLEMILDVKVCVIHSYKYTVA